MTDLEPVAWMRVTRGEITHLTHLATLGYEPLVRMSDARAAARERDGMRERLRNIADCREAVPFGENPLDFCIDQARLALNTGEQS